MHVRVFKLKDFRTKFISQSCVTNLISLYFIFIYIYIYSLWVLENPQYLRYNFTQGWLTKQSDN